MEKESMFCCLQEMPLIMSFLAILLLFYVAVFLWGRPKYVEEYYFSKQGITGPPYRFLIGNLKELAVMSMEASSHPMPSSHNILPRVLPFYHQWKNIYGTTFIMWFGPTKRLAIAEPKLIREIFISKSDFFEKVDTPLLVKHLEGEGLLNLKGEKWAQHKKIITPLFHMDNLKLFTTVVAKSVMDMLERWSKTSKDGEQVEIEVSEWFLNLSEDVLARTVLGSNYEDDKAIFELQAQQMVLAAGAFSKIFIPGYRFLPTKANRTSWKRQKEINKSLMKLIDRRMKELTNQESDDKNVKDLLRLMIQASRSCPSSNITVQDIVEECKTFYFAGKYTTSNVLTWTTILLAMHPEWQAKARDEVLAVCGSHEVPDKDAPGKLKILSMIITESLRLYPPAVATLRKAKCDIKLGPYKIPRGTELMIPILGLHHDKTIWGNDADEFIPTRFAMGVARAAKHPAGFLPFGLGIRKCTGQNLAILQVKLTLCIILQRFSFHLSPNYQHGPTVKMLLYPQYGAPIIFRRLPGHI